MRKWLLGAALCVASVGAMASGQARDLNGDGVADALYDATNNQTWIDHAMGVSLAFDMGWRAQFEASKDFGDLGWRVPMLFTAPPLFMGVQCSGDVGTMGNVACHSIGAGSEISRLDVDFGIDPFSWVTGLGVVDNVPDLLGSFVSVSLYAAVGRTTSYFIADPHSEVPQPVWLLADGDFGTSVAAVPEPSTYALMLAGLLAVLWRRRTHR